MALTIQTERSTKIYQLIENQHADIGFAFGPHMFPNVCSRSLFREEMVFLYHKNSDFARTGKIDDLKGENEIYLRWSGEFELWHQKYFSHGNMKKVALRTVSMLPAFLEGEFVWTIVSRSVGDSLIRRIPGLCCCDIDNPPPGRTAYVLTHKYPKPWVKESIDVFLDQVVGNLKGNPAVTLM